MASHVHPDAATYADQVSLRGKYTAEGDTPVTVDSNGSVYVSQGALDFTTDSVLAQPGTAASVNINSVVTTGAGTVLSYTCPAGKQAYIPFANYICLGGTPPTIRLRYTKSGGSVVFLYQGTPALTTQQAWQLGIWMGPGDLLDITVSTGGAGSSAAALISVLEHRQI